MTFAEVIPMLLQGKTTTMKLYFCEYYPLIDLWTAKPRKETLVANKPFYGNSVIGINVDATSHSDAIAKATAALEFYNLIPRPDVGWRRDFGQI